MASPQVQDRTYGHIDLSTGDAALHVDVAYVLFTNFPDARGIEKRQEWKFVCRMPKTIFDALSSSDWEFVLRSLDTRPADKWALSPIEMTIALGRAAGKSIEQVQAKVSRNVEENLFRIFGQKQIKAGNKAWLVPRSLVKTRGPHG